MNATAFARIVSMVAMAGAWTSCAGGKVLIVADHIEYPISTTSAVFDATGEIATPANGRLSVVHRFQHEWRQWSILWTFVPLSEGVADLSAYLTEQIEANKGDGVINLTVVARMDPFWWITSLVPLLPSHIHVVVEGDVFRVEESAR